MGGKKSKRARMMGGRISREKLLGCISKVLMPSLLHVCTFKDDTKYYQCIEIHFEQDIRLDIKTT